MKLQKQHQIFSDIQAVLKCYQYNLSKWAPGGIAILLPAFNTSYLPIALIMMAIGVLSFYLSDLALEGLQPASDCQKELMRNTFSTNAETLRLLSVIEKTGYKLRARDISHLHRSHLFGIKANGNSAANI